MKRSDYVEKRKEIKQDCEDKLAALDKVFAMFGGTPIGSSSSDSEESGNGWQFDISKREAVRDALKNIIAPTFTTKDVRNVLERDFPDYSKLLSDNQLSAILSGFASRKLIGIHKKKSGQSPAIYENKAPQ